MIDQVGDVSENAWMMGSYTFGKPDSIRAYESHFFVKVTINNRHKFAQKLWLKFADAFIVFSIALFVQVEVNFGEDSPNCRIKVIFDCIVSSSRHVLSN
jgi:hypothetical protein